MRRLPRVYTLIALAVLITLLAACGGSAGNRGNEDPGDQDPPPPPPVEAPAVSGFEPAAAWRGDNLTLTGEHFGDEQGAVTVGGVPADVTEWTDGSVAITVPPGAQRGWQQLTITNPHGTHSVDGLFVGVEFTGADDELQAFLNAQESGAAVLLQARTYAVGGRARELRGQEPGPVRPRRG